MRLLHASRIVLLAVAVAALALIAAQPAAAATCGQAVPYPGDDAAPAELANWLANGAVARGVPGELPVMAALVESGMRNLNYGDRDSVGFFQMRTGIWNKGEYAGYPQNPELQLDWFLDQAAKVRLQHIAAGKGDPASSDATYGVWIADIERPAEQYRGRYQLRLADARAVIALTCPSLNGFNPNAPKYSLKVPRKQRPARSGAIVARISCPAEACNISASAQFRLPGARGLLKLESDTTMLAAGDRGAARILVRRSLRSRMKRAFSAGSSSLARLRVVISGTDGATTVRVSKVRLAR